MISPKLVEVGRHINIELLTLSEVKDISGQTGDFKVSLTQHPRYCDMKKCIACGLCSVKCPKKVSNTYDANLSKKKAISVQYAQAVPLKYAIDPKQCLFLTKGKCKNCERFCPTGAINYIDQPRDFTLNVGAVILAGGCEPYNPKDHDVYGYQKSKNIITSLELERILSSSGPYRGNLVRPSDKAEPKIIAWLQCIGSRDVHIGARGYCSSVCCTYAVKEAMLANEHSADGLDTAIFYIDIRTTGKDFERYYNTAKDQYGVRFVKSQITHLLQDENGDNLIRYFDTSGRRVEESFDMVVRSVGLGANPSADQLIKDMGIKTDESSFVSTSSFHPVITSRDGVFVCGTIEAPKDIPTSVVEASACSGIVGSLLADARWKLTQTKELVSEIDIRGDAPRIGVFVCCCGTNIAGVIDVPSVVEYASTLGHVVYTEENLFACSQDSLDNLAKIIKKKKLNRIVLAACTPKTHEPLFQETLTNAGLNKYVFEMANIRNQCSWVHKKNPDAATQKAKDLVCMAAAKGQWMQPLSETLLKINQAALVVGGGIAGMTAARTLSGQGYETYIVEKASILGGNARHVHETWQGENMARHLDQVVDDIDSDYNIAVFTDSTITAVDGFVGNFTTTVQTPTGIRKITHGITIIASGANEYSPDQYLYEEDDRVITGLELAGGLVADDPLVSTAKTFVFLQCVGSRIPERPYCSKLCCTHSIKNALALKAGNPEINIYILYQDMRTYGLREHLYREARESGITFLRYNTDVGVDVVNNAQNQLTVSFTDTVLKRKLQISTDLLVLASAVVPPGENKLAKLYKVALNDDGFFMEAHAKLRPVDCATEGVFICGLAHAPKPVDESIAQAAAAAARAVTLLAKEKIHTSGTTAWVEPMKCSQCGVCLSICPFSAPAYIPMTDENFPGRARIEPVLCKGCGLCTASCRSGAIRLRGFDNDQIFSQIFALGELD